MNHEIFFENLEVLIDAPNGVQKLRELILQLAVQGKLVPQDPEDEPAAILLEKIAAEKDQLVKEKKIKRIRSLPQIDPQQIPYELPYNWEWVRLGDVGYDCGQRKPDKKFTYIDVSTINKEQGIISENVEILEPSEAPSRARKLVSKGSVIYATVRPYLLNIAIIDKQFEPEPIVSTAFAVLHPYSGILNKYLYYYLRSKPFITYVESEMIGMAYPAINDGKLYMGLVPIPPFEEQKRIVAKVDQLMALCDQLEARQQKKHEQRIRLNNAALDKLLTAPTPEEFAQHWQRICDNFDLLYDAPETVGQLRQAILQLAVQGKLVPQDSGDEPAFVLIERIATKKKSLINENKLKKNKLFQHIYLDESPYELPNGWEWVRLGNICLNITDGFHNTPKPTTSGIPYLTAQHIKPDFLDFDNCLYVSEKDHKELVRKTRPAKGDILVVNIGAGCGTPAIIEVEFEFSFKNVAILNRTKEINSRYLYYYLLLNRSDIYEQLTKGGAQPFLSLRKIRNIVFLLPPLIEQKRIVVKVDQLMTLCDELEAGLLQAQTEGGKLMEAVVHYVLAE